MFVKKTRRIKELEIKLSELAMAKSEVEAELEAMEESRNRLMNEKNQAEEKLAYVKRDFDEYISLNERKLLKTAQERDHFKDLYESLKANVEEEKQMIKERIKMEKEKQIAKAQKSRKKPLNT